MPNDDALELLKTWGSLFDVGEVRSFQGYRGDGGKDSYGVTVELLDMGGSAGDLRYMAYVRREDGRHAGGNNAATIDEAFANVHWDELDR